MMERMKAVDSLTVADLQGSPVWEYANRDGAGETMLRPIRKLPVSNLKGKVIGSKVTLVNGMQLWALIGSVDPLNSQLTEHVLTLSIERHGRWFDLARYHDPDYADRGPDALSRFLELPVDEIFPISFDVRQYAAGDPAALQGNIRKEPRQRLSRAEIIAMAVP